MNLYRQFLSSSSSAEQGVNTFVANMTQKYGPKRAESPEQSVIKCTWRLIYQTKGQIAFSAIMLLFGRLGYSRMIVSFNTYHIVSREDANEFKKWTTLKSILEPLAKIGTVISGIVFGLSGIMVLLLLISSKPSAPGVFANVSGTCLISALFMAVCVLGRRHISDWGRPAETGEDLEDSAISLMSVSVMP